jgi:N-glycosylase/DNA lyase
VDIKEVKDKGIIINSSEFNIEHIFTCGQCFRWINISKDVYVGVVNGRVLEVKETNEGSLLVGITMDEFNGFWRSYFDIDTDYSIIKEKLEKIDDHLKLSIEYGSGIRLLRQDVWELLISFILSANNRIPMIMRAVEGLSEKYGEFICEKDGKKYYSFPTPGKMAKAEVSDLRLSGVGFRDKYISAAAKMVYEGGIDLDELSNLPLDEARKHICSVKGVGPKVADCIILFGTDKRKAFPIGDYAGFAQQYLFFYARENLNDLNK